MTTTSLTPSKKISLKEWAVVLTPLLYMGPAYLYYSNGDTILGGCLFLLSLMRILFNMDQFRFITCSLVFCGVYMISLWLSFILVLFNGMYYRRDITSTVMLSCCLLVMVKMGSDVHAMSIRSKNRFLFMRWDLCVVALCVGNWLLHGVADITIVADFVKGIFWGYFLTTAYYDKNAFTKNMGGNIKQKVGYYLMTQMAPMHISAKAKLPSNPKTSLESTKVSPEKEKGT